MVFIIFNENLSSYIENFYTKKKIYSNQMRSFPISRQCFSSGIDSLLLTEPRMKKSRLT